MEGYTNLFLTATDEELLVMFPEYEEFNKHGWVSPGMTLDKFRNAYLKFFSSPLTIMERDYLYACAVRWVACMKSLTESN